MFKHHEYNLYVYIFLLLENSWWCETSLIRKKTTVVYSKITFVFFISSYDVIITINKPNENKCFCVLRIV